MKLVILFVFIGILNVFAAKDVLAQGQMISNISQMNEVNRNLERIYQHLDEDSTQETVSTYIGTIALFVSLG